MALLVVLATFRDYGITWDEELHQTYGDLVWAYFASGLTDLRATSYLDLFHYGALFDLGVSVVDGLFGLDPYELRHLVNACVGLGGLLGVWRLAALISGGERAGFLALLMLALTPRYWGHSFDNPKDIPFAVGYVWSVYFLVRLTLASSPVPRRLGAQCGLAIGLTMAVRAGGIVLLGYLAVVLFLRAFASRLFGRGDASVARLASIGGVATLVAWASMILPWPWAHGHPLTAPLLALAEFGKFPGRGLVLLGGALRDSANPPWSYTVHWLAVTLPVPHLLAIVAGIALAVSDAWRRPRSASTWARVLVLASAALPVAYVSFSGATLYDGMRHSLFVVPPLVALGACAFDRLWTRLTSRRARVVAWVVSGGLALSVGVEMVRLHPYQTVYFNELVGGLPGARGRYETDYWGASFREAVLDLNARIAEEDRMAGAGGAPVGRPYSVGMCGWPLSSTYYFSPRLRVAQPGEEPDFFIAHERNNCPRLEGPWIVAVERRGVPLSWVVDRRRMTHRRRGVGAG